MRLSRILIIILLLAHAGQSVRAQTYDLVFRGGFDDVSDAPASDAEAARFLTQATFGPTKASIAQLRGIGYSQWLEQQLSFPSTLSRPYLEDLEAQGITVTPGFRIERWLSTVVYAPDQLRQRMAWALSQILVVSDANSMLGNTPIGVAEYGDMLADGAFGNYRELLGSVSRSPIMAIYLSFLRNQQAFGAPLILPDENYAREVMQLFTIGLIKRNLDFSPVLDGGQTVPTYDQSVISEMARVFTGWTYLGSFNFFAGQFNYLPMMCFPDFHDDGAKLIFDGVSLPAVSNTEQGCADDMSNALDALHDHSNSAPFIARQLIQRFVSSNPSPAYIQRTAEVYNDNGQGEKGDLAAVLSALLMDTEARNDAPPDNAGKVREPLLKLITLWRAFDAIPGANGAMGLRAPQAAYAQRPLGASTVFNFYEPDYQQPGPIADADLYSPELQIYAESTALTVANDLYARTWLSYIGGPGGGANRALIDLSFAQALASDHAALVDEISLRLLYGQAPESARSILIALLDSMAGASAEQKALAVIHLVALSPQFNVQH